MSKQPAKKFTWAIKNFSSLQRNRTYSELFIVGGCKWNLFACTKGSNGRYLFLCLEVTGYGSLSPGWKRHARCVLNIVNQNSVKRFRQTEKQIWFDKQSPRWYPKNLLTLKEIFAKDNGYLVNGELKIVAEIEVLEVIGGLDAPEELTIMETMDFNGFKLPPSQVEFLSHMFERHPQIASPFRLKNSNLRTGYMSLLIGLIETLRQWPDNKTCIDEAYVTLRFLSDAGFKLDWLKKKLGEIAEKKMKAAISETRIKEIKEELKVLKQKSLHMETLLKKEEVEILAAKAPLSFDDVL